jgi:hypothetical protein
MDPVAFDQLIRHTLQYALQEKAARVTITTQMNGPRWHVRVYRPGGTTIHDDIAANPSRGDAATFAMRLVEKIRAT